MRKKSSFALMFEDLYRYYEDHGDDEKTWQHIFSHLDKFIEKTLFSTALFKDHYEEGKQEISIAIMNAFRSFNPDKGASLFTWATRLARQAIWLFIKNKVKLVPCECLNDLERFDICTEDRNVEEQIIYVEEEQSAEDAKQILTKVLGGPIEVEVFAMINGLFGYQEMKIKDIADETRLTPKTIYYIIRRNRAKLKNWSETCDIEETLFPEK